MRQRSASAPTGLGVLGRRFRVLSAYTVDFSFDHARSERKRRLIAHGPAHAAPKGEGFVASALLTAHGRVLNRLLNQVCSSR